MTSFIVTLALFWNQTLHMSEICPYSGKCRQESNDSFALSPPRMKCKSSRHFSKARWTCFRALQKPWFFVCLFFLLPLSTNVMPILQVWKLRHGAGRYKFHQAQLRASPPRLSGFSSPTPPPRVSIDRPLDPGRDTGAQTLSLIPHQSVAEARPEPGFWPPAPPHLPPQPLHTVLGSGLFQLF